MLVRTGDTPPPSARGDDEPAAAHPRDDAGVALPPAHERRAAGGCCATVRTVIVDEIHALARDKRGSHLAPLARAPRGARGRPVQRIGLSATQKPLEDVGPLPRRRRARVRARRRRDVPRARPRDRDPAVAARDRLLATSSGRRSTRAIAELVREHRTTLVFVNTRKMAERIAGAAHAAPRRGRRHEPPRQPLARAAPGRRGAAEGREAARARRDGVARARHRHRRRGPRDPGRRDALDRDVPPARRPRRPRAAEGPEGTALPADARRAGRRRGAPALHPRGDPRPHADAAAPARHPGPADRRRLRRGGVGRGRRSSRSSGARGPTATSTRAEFDDVVALHTDGRRALLHRDGVNGRLMATKRARLAALLSGGAIPDTADYQVRLEPEGTLVGTVNEDWAIESNGGDIFQLGNASWRVLRVEPGHRARGRREGPAADASRSGSARARAARASSRREIGGSCARSDAAGGARARTAANAGRGCVACGDALPARPRRADRRVRRGRARRARRGADAEPRHPRALLRRERRHAARRARALRVADQPRLGPRAAQEVLRRVRLRAAGGGERGGDRALARAAAQLPARGGLRLPAPGHRARRPRPGAARRARCSRRAGAGTRSARSSSSARAAASGSRPPLLRMRANDLLAAAFPQVLACPETLPGGPIEVPMEHPIVRQTIEDCLTEAMDVEGFLEVLRGLREDGSIERRAVDTVEPSAFARGILAAQPYTFLDDAPLEERRTQAVLSRRVLDVRTRRRARRARPRGDRARARGGVAAAGERRGSPRGAALDGLRHGRGRGAAVAAVARRARRAAAASCARATAGSPPRRRATRRRCCADGWRRSGPSSRAGTPTRRCSASSRPKASCCARGSAAARPGATGGCSRASTATRSTACGEEIEPVTAAAVPALPRAAGSTPTRSTGSRARAAWRRSSPSSPASRSPAAAWEGSVLPARVRGYRREWLDQLTLSGEVAWGRLWGSGAAAGPTRRTPICLVRREDLEAWASLAAQQPVPAGARPAGARRGPRGALPPRRDVLPGARARGEAPAHVRRGGPRRS